MTKNLPKASLYFVEASMHQNQNSNIGRIGSESNNASAKRDQKPYKYAIPIDEKFTDIL